MLSDADNRNTSGNATNGNSDTDNSKNIIEIHTSALNGQKGTSGPGLSSRTKVGIAVGVTLRRVGCR